MGPDSVRSVSIRRGNLEAGTVGEILVDMKAEVCKPSRAQDCQQTGRSSALRENQPC